MTTPKPWGGDNNLLLIENSKLDDISTGYIQTR